MKTYNEIVIERLRAGCNSLQSAAADIIEDQEVEIALWKEYFQEAIEILEISIATMKIATNRTIELEKALFYIHDNPHAHPDSVKWVVKDALGIKS